MLSKFSLLLPQASILTAELNMVPLTFGRIVFDGLLKGRDVAERAEEQDHFLLFVSYRSDLHKKPNRRP